MSPVTGVVAAWVSDLEPVAPDVVAAWRGIDEGRFISVRREVRRRAGEGSAARIVPQLAALAAALSAVVETMADADLRQPGGEASISCTGSPTGALGSPL